MAFISPKDFFFIIVNGLVMFSCSPGRDCRHKTSECAPEFVCEKGNGGSWQCVKKTKQQMPKDSESTTTMKPPTAQNKFKNCSEHSQCRQMAVECKCNKANQLVQQIFDRDGDEKGDEKVTYHYQHKQLTSAIVDEGLDGVFDMRHEYGYLATGEPSYWKIVNTGDGKSTEPSSYLKYVYNKNRNLVSMDYDTHIDGTIDRRCTFDPPCKPPIPNRNCRPVCQEVKEPLLLSE